MNRFLFIAILFVILGACTQTIDYPIPFEQKLVVTSFISPQDDSLVVAVALNQAVTGATSQNVAVQNATVNISDGSTKYTLDLMPQTIIDKANKWQRYGIKQPKNWIVAGKKYDLLVSATDGKQIKASCTVPNEQLKETDIKWLMIEKSPNKIRYEVTWSGLSNGLHYYNATVWVVLVSTDGKQKAYYKGIFVKNSNETLSTGMITYDGLPFVYDPAQSFCYILVGNTDKNYYDYHIKVFQQVRQNDGNLFPEPVLLPTNIDNGLGIFAALNTASVVKNFND